MSGGGDVQRAGAGGSPPIERLEARVVGDVQGVGFRWFVQRRAIAQRVVGWVANDADGGVSVVAEGLPAALDGLQVALAAGPPGARVKDVSARRLPATGGFARFEIRSGSHSGD